MGAAAGGELRGAVSCGDHRAPTAPPPSLSPPSSPLPLPLPLPSSLGQAGPPTDRTAAVRRCRWRACGSSWGQPQRNGVAWRGMAGWLAAAPVVVACRRPVAAIVVVGFLSSSACGGHRSVAERRPEGAGGVGDGVVGARDADQQRRGRGGARRGEALSCPRAPSPPGCVAQCVPAERRPRPAGIAAVAAQRVLAFGLLSSLRVVSVGVVSSPHAARVGPNARAAQQQRGSTERRSGAVEWRPSSRHEAHTAGRPRRRGVRRRRRRGCGDGAARTGGGGRPPRRRRFVSSEVWWSRVDAKERGRRRESDGRRRRRRAREAQQRAAAPPPPAPPLWRRRRAPRAREPLPLLTSRLLSSLPPCPSSSTSIRRLHTLLPPASAASGAVVRSDTHGRRCRGAVPQPVRARVLVRLRHPAAAGAAVVVVAAWCRWCGGGGGGRCGTGARGRGRGTRAPPSSAGGGRVPSPLPPPPPPVVVVVARERPLAWWWCSFWLSSS